MRYVVAYDIEDDRVRQRVADRLERDGWRVQRSVFECNLEKEELERLAGRLGKLLEESEGDIRFYRLCEACAGEAFGFGEVEEAPGGGEPWIVV